MDESRPPIPSREEYGALGPEAVDAPLAWSTVSGWLADARNYWLGTARTDGRPHVSAIWAVWNGEHLFFTTSPETVTARILARNPQALVHLESGSEVVIVEGEAERLARDAVPSTIVDAYAAKYGWRIEPDDAGMPYYALRPKLILAWKLPDIRATARRWRFE